MGKLEMFFKSVCDYKLSNHSNYLQFSNQEFFGVYLRDIISIVENSIENNLKNSYSHILINKFYNFMLKDKVFKRVDYLEYSRLLLKLKEYSENNSTPKKEQFLYFSNLKNKFLYPYEKELIKLFKEECQKETMTDEDYMYYISDNVLNFLLLIHDQRYLKYTIIDKFDKFESTVEMIDFLVYGKDTLDIDVKVIYYDKEFISYLDSSDQKYKIVNDELYLAIHDGGRRDFYSIINEQLRRIDSLMNIYRLYNDSQVDYDRTSSLTISSVYFDETITISFSSIYEYPKNRLESKNFKYISNNLLKLKDIDDALYRKLINVISYAVKNKNVISVNAFIDNWISLESVSSICTTKNDSTIENVVRFATETITHKLISTDINYILKDRRRKKMTFEDFVSKSINGTISEFIEQEHDSYKRYILTQYSKKFSDFKKLKEFFSYVESLIEKDLIKIYIIRNEFVHENNINLHYINEGKKLKSILLYSIDMVFKNLDQKIDYTDKTSISLENAIYSNIKSRFEYRVNALRILTENIKTRDVQLKIELDPNGKFDHIIVNMLLGNMNLLKVYNSPSEYKSRIKR